MQQLPKLNLQELPNLDLMRSFAVFLVAVSHLLLYTGKVEFHGHSFWFIGLLGVFLFFTHTTLVLMWSLERDPHPLRFYIRRVFRIYPLWLVVLSLSIAVRLPTSPIFAPEFRFYHASMREVIENITLTFNLGHGDRIIGAAWSLPIEVQMYIVLPFLFFFIRSYRRLWPLLLLDALALVTSRHLELPTSQSLLFCTPLFLPGAMAYVSYKRGKQWLPAWLFAVWLGCLTVGFTMWEEHRAVSFRGGWIFALLVGLSLSQFRQFTWKPLLRATHLIARYSYGVYLCHFAAIAVGVHYLRGASMALRVGAFVTTIVALPVILYHAVEKPMIRRGSALAKRVDWGPEPPVDELTLSIEPAP